MPVNRNLRSAFNAARSPDPLNRRKESEYYSVKLGDRSLLVSREGELWRVHGGLSDKYDFKSREVAVNFAKMLLAQR